MIVFTSTPDVVAAFHSVRFKLDPRIVYARTNLIDALFADISRLAPLVAKGFRSKNADISEIQVGTLLN